jgi:hypothetical protein
MRGGDVHEDLVDMFIGIARAWDLNLDLDIGMMNIGNGHEVMRHEVGRHHEPSFGVPGRAGLRLGKQAKQSRNLGEGRGGKRKREQWVYA